MLTNNLYRLMAFDHHEGNIVATLSIDSHHAIFEGHFPGQPVLPGVCMMQLIKELMEKALDKKLLLTEAAQCKFLSLVDPTKTNQLLASITYTTENNNEWTATAVLKEEDAVYLKMKSNYVISV